MKRQHLKFSLVAAILLLASPALAHSDTTYEAVPDQEQIERETIEAAENALVQSESLATSISFAFDYLTAFISEAHPPAFLTHAELKATTERLDGVRSILVVSQDGTLLHDAFNFPAPAINLAERDYVNAALAEPGLIFGKSVVGQTSGVPFIPVSSYKQALSSVVTAIIDPRIVRDPFNWCSGSCGGGLLTAHGEIVTSSPPGVPIHEKIVSTILESEENSGVFIYERPNFKALVAFRKSERFPIIAFASHAITSDGVLSTQ